MAELGAEFDGIMTGLDNIDDAKAAVLDDLVARAAVPMTAVEKVSDPSVPFDTGIDLSDLRLDLGPGFDLDLGLRRDRQGMAPLPGVDI
jgi:hypothetical protein